MGDSCFYVYKHITNPINLLCPIKFIWFILCYEWKDSKEIGTKVIAYRYVAEFQYDFNVDHTNIGAVEIILFWNAVRSFLKSVKVL